MKAATPRQMNAIDKYSIEVLGIPGIVLMENAALCVVGEIIKDLGEIQGKRVLVFDGKGNNGGDAFAVARHLYNKGAEVEVYVTAAAAAITGDAKVNLDIIKKLGLHLREVVDENDVKTLEGRLPLADILIDGIFGTGFKGELQGVPQKVMNIIKNSGRRIISIDIPSGVNGENGEAVEGALIADKTITFALPKLGMLLHPGCEHTGDLVVADIGIPRKAIETQNIQINMIDRKFVARLLPKRFDNSNKGSYGKVLAVTGSIGMTGAGCLAGKAALRTGAGLVYLGVPSSLVPIYDAALMEAITLPLEDRDTGRLVRDSASQIIEKARSMSVLAIGPGLSLNEEIREIVQHILHYSSVPLVLDADALNALAGNLPVLSGLKVPAVITPHPGEMARLAGISIKDVQNNRIKVACEFSARWKVVTVLKGARTIIACPDGTAYINPTGNSGMATGGTGDVLTGIISALIAQGLSTVDAAVAGVYLHGAAGDAAAEEKGLHGLIAGDLVEHLPYVIKGIGDEADESKGHHVSQCVDGKKRYNHRGNCSFIGRQ